jgi:hypothetical protein
MTSSYFGDFISDLPTVPRKYGGEDVECQMNRSVALELLYLNDGRHNPGHPYHGVYTGLWQNYQASRQH